MVRVHLGSKFGDSVRIFWSEGAHFDLLKCQQKSFIFWNKRLFRYTCTSTLHCCVGHLVSCIFKLTLLWGLPARFLNIDWRIFRNIDIYDVFRNIIWNLSILTYKLIWQIFISISFIDILMWYWNFDIANPPLPFISLSGSDPGSLFSNKLKIVDLQFLK